MKDHRTFQRRQFLKATSSMLATAALPLSRRAAVASSAVPRAPFHTIYSNDVTHIGSCQRPEQRTKEFTDDQLKASITEAAGVDAHFLQPGLGWIPWWSSSIYPIEAHYRWLRDVHGIEGVRKVDRYLLSGGDMLKTHVETCQAIGVAPFLSYRLNDGHHVRDLAKALDRGKPTPNMARHYWDNYRRFRIGPDVANWDHGVFDWSIPEVRDYKFALIEEACANYDIAGLELDMLRHWSRFNPNVASQQRFEIMTDFIARIRTMLDATAKQRGLPRRWLCVRVPANAAVRPEQGVDLAAITAAGCDMINLSYSYFTWQDTSAAKAREEVGSDPSIYVEMTHTTMTGRATAGSGTQPFLRTTDDQFYTTAQLAYAQGADGVSLFNFPYYRYHVTDAIGPFCEPPFYVLPKLRPAEVGKQKARWYFLSAGRNDEILGQRRLPTMLKRSHPQTFAMTMLVSDTAREPGLLRLRFDRAVDDRAIEAAFNGVALESIAPVTMPIEHRYVDTWLGEPNELACFAFPRSLPLKALNEITALIRKGAAAKLVYLDVTWPG